jgi:hypothetical protein
MQSMQYSRGRTGSPLIAQYAAVDPCSEPLLHDSVLVAASETEAAKAIMEQAFEMATGESCGKLKVDFGLQLQ